jgi:hypothetical protein
MFQITTALEDYFCSAARTREGYLQAPWPRSFREAADQLCPCVRKLEFSILEE